MNECIFCKIISGEIPGKFARRDDDVVALTDLHPQAPTHVLVMPVKHAANLGEFVSSTGPDAVSKLMRTAAALGREYGGDEGYRIVINSGPKGGQTVDHLHIHVLAGRQMTWPPG